MPFSYVLYLQCVHLCLCCGCMRSSIYVQACLLPAAHVKKDSRDRCEVTCRRVAQNAPGTLSLHPFFSFSASTALSPLWSIRPDLICLVHIVLHLGAVLLRTCSSPTLQLLLSRPLASGGEVGGIGPIQGRTYPHPQVISHIAPCGFAAGYQPYSLLNGE